MIEGTSEILSETPWHEHTSYSVFPLRSESTKEDLLHSNQYSLYCTIRPARGALLGARSSLRLAPPIGGRATSDEMSARHTRVRGQAQGSEGGFAGPGPFSQHKSWARHASRIASCDNVSCGEQERVHMCVGGEGGRRRVCQRARSGHKKREGETRQKRGRRVALVRTWTKTATERRSRAAHVGSIHSVVYLGLVPRRVRPGSAPVPRPSPRKRSTLHRDRRRSAHARYLSRPRRHASCGRGLVRGRRRLRTSGLVGDLKSDLNECLRGDLRGSSPPACSAAARFISRACGKSVRRVSLSDRTGGAQTLRSLNAEMLEFESRVESLAGWGRARVKGDS